MNAPRQSTLHLQMGQEVIYLLLTIAVATALILVAWMMSQPQADVVDPPTPPEDVAPPEDVVEPIAEPPEEEKKRPPLIALTESDGFSFASGSTEITASFAKLLEDVVVPRIRELGDIHQAEIVEVVGHTDGVPLHHTTRAGGNLDAMLGRGLDDLAGETLAPSDNVGLGMGRAVAVALALRRAGLEARYVLIPLSAGPLVGPGDNVASRPGATPDAQRRRIEIRLRRRFSGAPATVAEPH